MPEELRKKIKTAPDCPGVYLMKDKAGKVIYIGKAKSLKNRLSNYLSGSLDPKGAALVGHIVDLELRLCPTDTASLILEASLIRRFKPKYNIHLRDDKNFPLVRISREDYPLLSLVRRKENDGAVYFGPYTNAGLLREALRAIRHVFPYRTCKAFPKRACIYFRMNLCPAPCIGGVTKNQYRFLIKGLSLVLSGQTEDLIKKMTKMMRDESRASHFEKAARLRDNISALNSLSYSEGGDRVSVSLDGLRKVLRLPSVPRRIEAFDISNISGEQAVGSMVSFVNGLADKDNYRRFRIKTVRKVDDYAMLSEILKRRYLKLLCGSRVFPDLVLIDGGIQHVARARAIFKSLGIGLPLAGIAKKEEKVYFMGSIKEADFSSHPEALNLLCAIRDEAHRFAVSYHRLLRKKNMLGK
mgnify:CR=1 FL=1